ncbi:drug:proton antiporter, partial [bacterium]
MPASKQAKIIFSPSGKRGRFAVGTSILQAARELGVDIDSICGGRTRCGRCQVEVIEGDFAKEGIHSKPGHLSDKSDDEHICQQQGRLRADYRLACQARILGDVGIDVPASSQVHQQVVRKDFEAQPIKLDPVIHLYFTEVSEPDLKNPKGDLQRLLKALKSEWGLTGLGCDSGVLQALQSAMRNGKWQLTVAIRNGTRIVAIWPGFREHVYGAAVDVGSTTIAVHLCDLSSGEVLASAGAMNPQIRFGEDLMSRVSYAMLNPGGTAQMTKVVRGAINDLIRNTLEQAEADPEALLEITLVGNPIMHHLLLGLDPVPLGSAPFSLATDQAIEWPAAKLDISLATGTRAYLLPCIAGHVGADTAAVILAEAPWESDDISLIIDVGTNAEIVLGNQKRLLAASSPTGPAFEGAQISSGQRAAPGAIERVRIDPETLEPRFKVIGGKLWSDDPGFEAELAGQEITGICGSGIIEVIAGMYLAGIIRPDGIIDGAMADRNPRIKANGRTFSYLLYGNDQEGQTPEIHVHQADVRAIQLAKAALYAGVRLLMDRMAVEKVDRIRL